jgi:hypothetical protein
VAEERPSSDLNECDSWFNFDDDNDMDSECESSSQSSTESLESDDYLPLWYMFLSESSRYIT